MHDPCTLAFAIRLPFTRVPLVHVWHRDPCKGPYGDDSCGYSIPHLTKRQLQAVRDEAEIEGRYPYFLATRGKAFAGTSVEAEVLQRALILTAARIMRIKVSFNEAAELAALQTHSGNSHVPRNFCFLPGWHTNYLEDRAEDRAQQMSVLLHGIGRQLLMERRRWYRHPKWHVHHWQLRFPLIHHLRARLSDRNA